MPVRSTPALGIRELLVLCLRWASGSANRILQLIGWLGKWLRPRVAFKAILNDGKVSARGIAEAPDGYHDVYIRASQKVHSSRVEGRMIFLSCSSAPVVPAPVHTHEQAGSMDLIPARSTTLLDNPSFSLATTAKDKNNHSGSFYSAGENPTDFHVCFSTESEPLGASHLSFKPTLPSERPRYDRGIIIGNTTRPWSFGPLETLSISENEITIHRTRACSPWLYYVHPEGQPYYSFKDELHRFSYLTEADVTDSNMQAKLERFIDAIEKKANSLDSPWMPESVEVVLEIDDIAEWSYYMADLDRRCIFWLQNFDPTVLLGAGFDVESKDQFQYALAPEFWLHVEHFPVSARQPMEEILDEVLKVLSYWSVDELTSGSSTVPYEQAQVRSLMDSIKGFKLLEGWTSSSHAVVSVARAMHIISHERFFDFYGFHGARLSVFQSVRGKAPDQRSHSILVRCLSPLLFFAPTNYLWRLERLRIDGVMRERFWNAFYDKLDSDLSGTLLLSTVLLAANVTILAGPISISSETQDLQPTPATVANQLSAIASLGAIIIGLQLKYQDIRVKSKGCQQSMIYALKYFSRSKHEQLNLEGLAIHFSLPFAMLMWSVVTFAASIAIACFGVVNGMPNLASQIVYGVFGTFIMMLVLWSVLTSWEFAIGWTWSNLLKLSKTKHGAELDKEQDMLESEPQETGFARNMDLSMAEKAGAY